MYVVAGVTSSGKSTFLNSTQGVELGLDNKSVVFANQVNLVSKHGSLLGENGVFHYNLLRPVRMRGSEVSHYDFYADPAFSFIEKNASRLTAIIILAKEDTIYRRVDRRTKSEDGNSASTYHRAYWRTILRGCNLNELYERFTLEMEALGIPCCFYLSSDDPQEPFRKVHRYSAKTILNSGDVEPLGDIQSNFLDDCEYQKLHLGNGVNTKGQNRSSSLLNALALDLRNKTVLDVGSAMGGLAFSAEQMGARQVVGLEPKSNRFRACVELKRVINSECEFYNETVASFGDQKRFDHVFILNVVHHMPDFIYDLRILTEITNETLTLEFPGLADSKYQSTIAGAKSDSDPRTPLIGVSLSSQDQTFVFSPEGLRRILMDHFNGFKSYEVWQSPMRHRFFMRLYKDGHRGSHAPIQYIKQKPYTRVQSLSFGVRIREIAKKWKFARVLWRSLNCIGKN